MENILFAHENIKKRKIFINAYNGVYITEKGPVDFFETYLDDSKQTLKKTEEVIWCEYFQPVFIDSASLRGFELEIKASDKCYFALVLKDSAQNEFFTKFTKLKKGKNKIHFLFSDFSAPKWSDKNIKLFGDILSVGFYLNNKTKKIELEFLDLYYIEVPPMFGVEMYKTPFFEYFNGKVETKRSYLNKDSCYLENNKLIIKGDFNQNSGWNKIDFSFFKNRASKDFCGILLKIDFLEKARILVELEFEGGKNTFLPEIRNSSEFVLKKPVSFKKFKLTGVNFLIKAASKINAVINGFFIQSQQTEEIPAGYEVSSIEASELRKLNLRTESKDSEINLNLESNSLEIDYSGSEVDKSAYSIVKITHSELVNLILEEIEGIGLYLTKYPRNDLRLILETDNGLEKWSNPVRGVPVNSCFYYFKIKDFFFPVWQDASGDAKFLKSLNLYINGEEYENIKLYKIVFYAADIEKVVQNTKQKNEVLYDTPDYKINENFISLVESNNIISNSKKLSQNEVSFRIVDNGENFLIIRFNMLFSETTDFSGFNQISSIINSSLNATVKFVLTDIENNEISSKADIIRGGNLSNIIFKKSDFNVEKNLSFNFAHIKYVEFHFNNISSEKSKKGIINFTLPRIAGNKISSDLYYNLEDFNFFGDSELKNYWVSSGKDSFININGAWKHPMLNYPCLKVDFGINTENSLENWIILKRNDFGQPVSFKGKKFITFNFLSDKPGFKVRFSIRDTDNNISSYEWTSLTESSVFTKVNIPLNKLEGKASLQKVINYEFYIGLEWQKVPVQGRVYFATWSPVSLMRGKSQKLSKISNIKKENTFIENLENKISTSSPKINISGTLYDYKDISYLMEKNIKKGKNSFSLKDIRIEETRKSKKWGLSGAALFIEPTNLCNLSCIMCNHGDNSFERSLGVMKLKDFKKITDEIKSKKLNIWEVVPYWLGESFIHPQINEFIELLSQIRRIPGNIQHYNIHTNGNVLTDEHIETLINSELDSILFSIDAATEETYQKIRVNGELNVVIENIKRLMLKRKEANVLRPAVILQFIVMDENVDEIMSFVELGRKIGIDEVIYAGRKEDNKYNLPTKPNLLFPQIDKDVVFIKSLEPNALTKAQKHREIISSVKKGVKRRPCRSLWQMCSITWDGWATACCRDDQVKMPIGNVIEEGLESVWYGDALKELRLAHVLGEFDKLPKCRDCLNWVKYPLKDEEVESWLYSVGEEKLIKIYKNRFGRS
ncbi:MAG: radical SAM/SPASM domain-containing protein [Candidatus Muiribacteriota bacterium]